MLRKRRPLHLDGLGKNTPNAKRLRLNLHAKEKQPPNVAEAVDENVVNSADLPFLPRPMITLPVGSPLAASSVTKILPVAFSYIPKGFHLTSYVGNMTVICEQCQAT